ncbi:MAG: hypothetical protein LBC30_01060 [Puniceicoccales bacterium]|jgi:hypothetical protein|nr:hypothetical protein [Puniceicoccales bacterium]
MFQKVSKMMAGGILFLGIEAMAEPLEDYDDIVAFANQICKEDSADVDPGLVATVVRGTVCATSIPIPMRVFILNRLDRILTLEERLEGLQDVINGGIETLLTQDGWEHLPTGYADMSREMKLAHMLWLSQTVSCESNELKNTYDTDCLKLICKILQQQQGNGNELYRKKNLKKG